jgi:ADP-ribose pyrophosphatase
MPEGARAEPASQFPLSPPPLDLAHGRPAPPPTLTSLKLAPWSGARWWGAAGASDLGFQFRLLSFRAKDGCLAVGPHPGPLPPRCGGRGGKRRAAAGGLIAGGAVESGAIIDRIAPLMHHELDNKQVIYAGKKLRLEVHHLVNEAGKRLQREIVVHGGSVVICPILADGTVVLIRNRRWAAGKTLIELPAGTLEKGEVPINCAGRELLEETGYLAGRLRPLVTFYTSPGILSELMHAFVATELKKQKTALEEGEEIESLETSLADAIHMIRHGQIIDAKTIAVLLAYERFVRNDDGSGNVETGPIGVGPS